MNWLKAMVGLERDDQDLESKTIIGQNDAIGDYYGGGVSLHDGDNFRTNQVTVAEWEDNGGGRGALNLSTAWACVNLLAGTQASLPLVVYRNVNGRREVAYDHPLYYCLHDSPNAEDTALDFMEFLCASLELHGHAYSPIGRIGGRVSALGSPISPEIVTVRKLGGGRKEYRWTEDGRLRVVPDSDMLHIKGALGGLSTLAYARRTFGLARSVETAANATFRNGIRPNVALEVERDLAPEKVREARQLISENYQGTMNAGLPFLAHSGMKVKQLSINPDDAQMLESRAFSVEEICRFFGVPPFMVGHTEKSTSWGTGLEQQMRMFYVLALRKRLERVEQALKKQLLTPKDRAAGIEIEFNVEGLLRGDSKSRAEFYASGLQNGWRTINEVRALENLPPIEGGDVARVQVQNAPITTADQLALPKPAQEDL
jgi:HK97 family phage portal protein